MTEPTPTPTPTTPGRSRFRISPLGGSLMVHALLLSALLMWGMGRFKSVGERGDQTIGGGGSGAATTVQQDLDDAVSKLAQRIDSGIEDGAATPVVEHLRAAKANVEWLDANSSEEAVGAIAEKVRKAYRTPERAYAPVDPPPPGSFDMRSMLPYSSQKRVDADGVERAYQTWVDKDGRTMVQTRRRITDDEGKTWIMQGVEQADGSLFETQMEDDGSAFDSALETASSSSLMQKLFREAVLPVLEGKRQQEQTERQAERGQP